MYVLRYNNTLYYRLQMICPICVKNKRITQIAFWTHYEDDGNIYVGSDGFLLCAKCGRRAHLRYWRFHCPYHSYGNKYSVSLKEGRCVDPETILSAIGLSFPLIRRLSKIWLSKFIQNV